MPKNLRRALGCCINLRRIMRPQKPPKKNFRILFFYFFFVTPLFWSPPLWSILKEFPYLYFCRKQRYLIVIL